MVKILTKTFFVVMTIWIGFGVSSAKVKAHDRGLPFLMINGKYAQSNPYYLGGPHIPAAQDISLDTYVVDTPITFDIDLNTIQVPREIATESTFRWSWEEKSTAFEYGTKVSHTYAKPGSYLITLAVKAPSEIEFIIIDTIQINVVPTEHYQLPTAKIAVHGTSYKLNNPITFEATTTTDPSASLTSVYWTSGSGVSSANKTFTNIYIEKDFLEFVFLRATDSHGLTADSAVQIDALDGTIHVSSIDPTDAHVPVIKTSFTKLIENRRFLYIVPVLSLLLIGGVSIWLRKRRLPKY